MKVNTSHIAFTDESNWNTGRYRSISAISMPTNEARNMHHELCELAKESNISEVHWKKLRSAKMRFAAEKYIKCLLCDRYCSLIRVDILTWDTDDARCKGVIGRDDIENYNIMYYQLLHHVMHNIGDSSCSWTVIADVNSAVHWQMLSDFLINKRLDTTTKGAVFLEKVSIPNLFLDSVTIYEGCSNIYNIIQIADLFAGIATYSHNKSELYDEITGQTFLINRASVFSGGDKERILFLKEVLPIILLRAPSIEWTSKGLVTKNPKDIINFWFYTPQGTYDKAPVKDDFTMPFYQP